MMCWRLELWLSFKVIAIRTDKVVTKVCFSESTSYEEFSETNYISDVAEVYPLFWKTLDEKRLKMLLSLQAAQRQKFRDPNLRPKESKGNLRKPRDLNEPWETLKIPKQTLSPRNPQKPQETSRPPKETKGTLNPKEPMEPYGILRDLKGT